MILEIIFGTFLLSSLIFSGGAFFLASRVYVEVEAQKKSTHRIQYVPADQLQDFSFTDAALEGAEMNSDLTEEQKKTLTKDPFESF